LKVRVSRTTKVILFCWISAKSRLLWKPRKSFESVFEGACGMMQFLEEKP